MSQTFTRVRQPAMAGRFYDAAPADCKEMAIQLCEPDENGVKVPHKILGAVLPHAGWLFSGAVAGRTIRQMHEHTEAVTVLLTGAIHTPVLTYGPTLDSADAWATPLGVTPIDRALRDAIGGLDEVTTLDMAHESEHSLEVELPLLQQVFGEQLKIVPCLIPPHANAAAWGRAMGQLLKGWESKVVVIASSDLTHYGPNYRFAPKGVGGEGIAWAHDVNDKRMLDMIEAMDENNVVNEARAQLNACGSGSIATTIAAVKEMKSNAKGYVLEHTSSAAIMADMGEEERSNSVGYAGIVFG